MGNLIATHTAENLTSIIGGELEMIAATLFSGIGAPETAMPHWRWPWHAEIDKFPSAVMACRHPESVNIGDVTGHEFTERAAAIAKPSVLVFGSPCQSFSVAGKRLGLDDPRGNMVLCALGIIARLEPRWFVFENVPGLLSSSEGRDFGLFLRAVDELGYSLAWAVLDAQYFGVAQRRERVFAVGYLGDWRGPAAVLFEPEGLCWHSSPCDQTRQEIASGLGAGSKRSGGRIGRREAAGNQLIAGTLTSVTHSLSADGFYASEDDTGRGCPIVPVAFDTTQITSKTNRCHPLAAGAHLPAIAFSPVVTVALRGRENGGVAEMGGEQATALRACQGGGDKPHVLTSAVRRLTPRECERLMGFQDDYTLINYMGKIAADGPRYKSLGNSMAVPCVRWILTRIEAVDRLMGARHAA